MCNVAADAVEARGARGASSASPSVGCGGGRSHQRMSRRPPVMFTHRTAGGNLCRLPSSRGRGCALACAYTVEHCDPSPPPIRLEERTRGSSAAFRLVVHATTPGEASKRRRRRHASLEACSHQHSPPAPHHFFCGCVPACGGGGLRAVCGAGVSLLLCRSSARRSLTRRRSSTLSSPSLAGTANGASSPFLSRPPHQPSVWGFLVSGGGILCDVILQRVFRPVRLPGTAAVRR